MRAGVTSQASVAPHQQLKKHDWVICHKYWQAGDSLLLVVSRLDFCTLVSFFMSGSFTMLVSFLSLLLHPNSSSFPSSSLYLSLAGSRWCLPQSMRCCPNPTYSCFWLCPTRFPFSWSSPDFYHNCCTQEIRWLRNIICSASRFFPRLILISETCNF